MELIMKLQKRPNSKATMERMDRGYYQMIGKKYPIVSARKWKKMCQAAYNEYMAELCPCGY
jgi:hypothetical protein